jgi:hypothetical protein
MWLGYQRHFQAALAPGKTAGTNCTIAWAGMEILVPLKFEPRNAQPLANTILPPIVIHIPRKILIRESSSLYCKVNTEFLCTI